MGAPKKKKAGRPQKAKSKQDDGSIPAPMPHSRIDYSRFDNIGDSDDEDLAGPPTCFPGGNICYCEECRIQRGELSPEDMFDEAGITLGQKPAPSSSNAPATQGKAAQKANQPSGFGFKPDFLAPKPAPGKAQVAKGGQPASSGNPKPAAPAADKKLAGSDEEDSASIPPLVSDGEGDGLGSDLEDSEEEIDVPYNSKAPATKKDTAPKLKKPANTNAGSRASPGMGPPPSLEQDFARMLQMMGSSMRHETRMAKEQDRVPGMGAGTTPDKANTGFQDEELEEFSICGAGNGPFTKGLVDEMRAKATGSANDGLPKAANRGASPGKAKPGQGPVPYPSVDVLKSMAENTISYAELLEMREAQQRSISAANKKADDNFEALKREEERQEAEREMKRNRRKESKQRKKERAKEAQEAKAKADAQAAAAAAALGAAVAAAAELRKQKANNTKKAEKVNGPGQTPDKAGPSSTPETAVPDAQQQSKLPVHEPKVAQALHTDEQKEPAKPALSKSLDKPTDTEEVAHRQGAEQEDGVASTAGSESQPVSRRSSLEEAERPSPTAEDAEGDYGSNPFSILLRPHREAEPVSGSTSSASAKGSNKASAKKASSSQRLRREWSRHPFPEPQGHINEPQIIQAKSIWSGLEAAIDADNFALSTAITRADAWFNCQGKQRGFANTNAEMRVRCEQARQILRQRGASTPDSGVRPAASTSTQPQPTPPQRGPPLRPVPRAMPPDRPQPGGGRGRGPMHRNYAPGRGRGAPLPAYATAGPPPPQQWESTSVADLDPFGGVPSRSSAASPEHAMAPILPEGIQDSSPGGSGHQHQPPTMFQGRPVPPKPMARPSVPKATLNAATRPAPRLPSFSMTPPRAETKRRVVEEEEALCCICLEWPPEIVLQPCGHNNMCEKCAHNVKNLNEGLCPECRCKIEAIIKPR